jgi:hypothetical protein
MGTYFTKGASKAAIVAECVQSSRALVHTVKGNHLWAIGQTTHEGKPLQYVILFKLENDPGYGWGYKPISEDMGPYADDCPLEYVRAVEAFPVIGFAAEFRARIYKRHGVAAPAAGGAVNG